MTASRTSPLRVLWLGWALWVSTQVSHIAGWIVGAMGAMIALLLVASIIAALNEDECEPVWKDEVPR